VQRRSSCRLITVKQPRRGGRQASRAFGVCVRFDGRYCRQMVGRHANARRASTGIISCELFILAANTSSRRHGGRTLASKPLLHPVRRQDDAKLWRSRQHQSTSRHLVSRQMAPSSRDRCRSKLRIHQNFQRKSPRTNIARILAIWQPHLIHFCRVIPFVNI